MHSKHIRVIVLPKMHKVIVRKIIESSPHSKCFASPSRQKADAVGAEHHRQLPGKRRISASLTLLFFVKTNVLGKRTLFCET